MFAILTSKGLSYQSFAILLVDRDDPALVGSLFAGLSDTDINHMREITIWLQVLHKKFSVTECE